MKLSYWCRQSGNVKGYDSIESLRNPSDTPFESGGGKGTDCTSISEQRPTW